MSKSLRLFFLLVIVAALSGCSLFHKKTPKSSAHMVEGDASTLHFTDKPESAGGTVNTY